MGNVPALRDALAAHYGRIDQSQFDALRAIVERGAAAANLTLALPWLCQPLGRHCLSLNLNLGRRPTPQQWPLRSHCHWHVVDRVGAHRVALDQRRKYLRARSPRTGRETDESAHGWARCRSISGAVTRCVGAMYVYILIYTAWIA